MLRADEHHDKDLTVVSGRCVAVSAGFYHSPGWGQDYPKIQILTIEELLHGAEIKMPPQHGTFKEAQRVRMQGPEQSQLDLG